MPPTIAMLANPRSGLPGWLVSAVLLLSTIAMSACTTNTGSGAKTTETAAASETSPAREDQDKALETESDRLNAWFETKFEEGVQRSPLFLTILGRKEKYAEFDDASEAAEDEEFAIDTQNLNELRNNFDYEKLDAETKLSRDIWIYQYERSSRAREFRDHSYVFDQMNGPQSFYPTFMINYHRVDERSDMEAYISRLGGIATAIRTLLARAQKYAARGVRPPLFAYEGVLEQSEKIISGAPFNGEDQDSAIWLDAKTKIDALKANDKIGSEEAAVLTRAAREKLVGEFKPAYEALINWIKADMQNADKVATGVGKLPRGKAFYEERLRYSTTTQRSAAEIHQLGLDEVDRLTAEMRDVMKKVGFQGSLKVFFEHLRTGEQFYYPDDDKGREQYIADATAKLDSIKKRLPEFFGILPKADLVVKRVEPYREQDGAAQHYNAGTPDGSRPGTYYAHLSDMTAMPINQLEVIAYHEGLPGHHMQISIAQELQSLPSFRRQGRFTAYVEGWALYSEALAVEMGAYEDPYSDFGRITTEIWRAIRLVVDTGLHSMGWTEAEAIDYFSSHSPEPLEKVTSEIQRYIVTPGQATSYKIGMLKIQELRAQAEQALGDRFSIKGFHDTVLGGGAVPLALLERRVNDWVQAQL